MTVLLLFFLLFNAANVGIQFYFLGAEGGGARLQDLYYYAFSPYNLSILGYFSLQRFTSLFGLAAFGLLVMAISAFSRTPLVPFFMGGAVYGTPFFLVNMPAQRMDHALRIATHTESSSGSKPFFKSSMPLISWGARCFIPISCLF